MKTLFQLAIYLLVKNIMCDRSGFEKILDNMVDMTEKENNCFLGENNIPSLVSLVKGIIDKHYNKNILILLSDDYYSHSPYFRVIHKELMKNHTIRHGQISMQFDQPYVDKTLLKPTANEVPMYLIFMKTLELSIDLVSPHISSDTKVIVVSPASKWQIGEFLSSIFSRAVPNLVVVQDLRGSKKYGSTIDNDQLHCFFKSYTHELNVDSIGSSKARLLTTWKNNSFTRDVNFFPKKFKKGLNGIHLIVAASEHPPFAFRLCDQHSDGYSVTKWDGIEVRLLQLIGQILNFTVEFREVIDRETDDSTDMSLNEVKRKKADMAIGGICATFDRLESFSLSIPHAEDCAKFISLTSTALPKYRAIMGPFLWDVWLCLTSVYLLATVLIAYSVWHSIRPLMEDINELQNMFWYVFGTFTNCFTFSGKNSWSKGEKNSTKIFIGSYWAFTIIITAAYTGSIIAFITLPVYPEVVDTARDFLKDEYKTITLESDRWLWMLNLSKEDSVAQELSRQMTITDSIFNGLTSVLKSVHEDNPTAFFGSEQHMEYIVKTNFSTRSAGKRAIFHISKECFYHLPIVFAMHKGFLWMEEFNDALIRSIQSGYLTQIDREVQWYLIKNTNGKLLQAPTLKKIDTPEERQLTLEDTQGMFLVLGAGNAIAIAALVGELIVWIYGQVKSRKENEPTLKTRAFSYTQESCRKLSKIVFGPYRNSIHLQALHLWTYFGSRVSLRDDFTFKSVSVLGQTGPWIMRSFINIKERFTHRERNSF